MSGYIQIGSTALRDPASGEFLPSVPLFIRAEDRQQCEAPVIDGDALARSLAEKFRIYKAESRKAQKKSR